MPLSEEAHALPFRPQREHKSSFMAYIAWKRDPHFIYYVCLMNVSVYYYKYKFIYIEAIAN